MGCGSHVGNVLGDITRAGGGLGHRSPYVVGGSSPLLHRRGELDAAVAEAVALGASLATAQPQENVPVLLDPAGHPFCLCLDEG
jgi:hypothetical protein